VREERVYIYLASDLDLWIFDLKFALPIIRVQGHVSTKFEVSKFLRLSDFE